VNSGGLGGERVSNRQQKPSGDKTLTRRAESGPGLQRATFAPPLPRGGPPDAPHPGFRHPFGVPSPGATAQRPLRGSRPDRERCPRAAKTLTRSQPPPGREALLRRYTGVPSPGATAQRPLRGSRPTGDAHGRVSPSRRLTPSGLPSRSGPSPTGSQTLSRTLIAQFLPNGGEPKSRQFHFALWSKGHLLLI
jgi:hypothetical protein